MDDKSEVVGDSVLIYPAQVGDSIKTSDGRQFDVVHVYENEICLVRKWPWHKYLWKPALQRVVRAQCALLPGRWRWWL